MRLRPIILSTALVFVLTSCSSVEAPRLEVSSYSEKTILTHIPLKMNMDCDNCSTEVFSWNNKAVKLEIKKIVRGNEEKESLERRLEGFKIDFTEEEGRLDLRCRYTGGGRITDGSVRFRIYLPKKTTGFTLRQEKGEIAFLDDFNGDMEISATNLDIDINKIEGKFNCKIDKGNINVLSGILGNGSGALVSNGNMKITAAFEDSGSYDFKTDFGILDLSIPGDTNAVFDTYGVLEAADFKQGGKPSRFRLESKMGKINITKY